MARLARRLHACDAGERNDLEDTAQLGQRQHDTVRTWHRAARQSCAGATCDERNAQFVAHTQYAAYLVFRFGQHDRERWLPERRQAIAFERRGLFALRQQAFGRHDRGKGGEQILPLVVGRRERCCSHRAHFQA
jgi:hypothetical protein